jgi:hypothetical protein
MAIRVFPKKLCILMVIRIYHSFTQERKPVIVVDGGTYYLWKIGAAFAEGSRIWRWRKQPLKRAHVISDW